MSVICHVRAWGTLPGIMWSVALPRWHIRCVAPFGLARDVFVRGGRYVTAVERSWFPTSRGIPRVNMPYAGVLALPLLVWVFSDA